MSIDHSPVKNTCPWINKVIAVLRDCECKYNSNDIDDAIDALESVRDANSELREWGNELHHRIEELEEEVARLEREV